MKYRSTVFLLLCLLSANCAYMQQKNIDSLEQQLLNPTNGLSKTEILNELSWYYALSDITKGLKRADSAIALAKETPDSLQLGIAYERKGFNYQNMGKDSMTLLLYEKAENIYTRINHKKRLAALTFNKGNFHFFRSNYTKSLEEGNKALNIFESNNDSLRMSRALNQIALNHLYLGNYTLSLETFQQGQLMLELTNNRETQFYAEILGNKALLHEKLSEFKKALEIQNRALRIHKKINYPSGVSNTYANIGKLYGRLNQHQKALEMLNASMKIKEEMGNQYRIANGLTNLGITLTELRRYSQAIEKLNRAKSIYEELEHFSNLSAVHKNLGDIFLELAQPRKAGVEFERAIFYAEKAKDKRAEFLGKEGLSVASFKNADYKRAYNLQEEATKLKDSVLSNEKKDELTKLEAKYEYDKEKAVLQANFEKDKAIDQAKIEQQILVRNTAIGGGILGMAAILIGFILTGRKREAELNTKIVTSQLQTLKAQLSPHFIFNTLNSINDYIQNNQQDVASTYLTRFSKMMRKILENSTEEEIPLSEEIDFLENYINLEQERLENKFTYNITIDNNIDREETLIPPGLLQPFVENSIWHGLSEKKGSDGTLEISVEKKHDSMIINLDDNGIGMDASKQPKNSNRKSFGTSSVQDRLNLLNKLKGESVAKVQFIDKAEGVRVQIQLPLIIDSDI